MLLQTGSEALIKHRNVQSSDLSRTNDPQQHFKMMMETHCPKEQKKMVTQWKYAMTSTRFVDHRIKKDYPDNNVENLDSNVPYIELLDPLDSDHTDAVSKQKPYCSGSKPSHIINDNDWKYRMRRKEEKGLDSSPRNKVPCNYIDDLFQS